MADPGFKIDDLIIEISVKSAAAASSLKDLAKDLREAANAATGGYKVLTNIAKGAEDMGKETEEATKSVSKFKVMMSGVGETIKGVASGFGEMIGAITRIPFSLLNKVGDLARMVLRIATYRMIRTAIKAVTAAAKEGFEAFKNWDISANGGAVGVQRAIEGINTSLTQLKGQLGAFLGGLLTQAAPVIQYLIQGLTTILDTLQMISRVLQGQGTYYKFIGTEINKTTGAAKALKNVLFGFDELNVLPSASGAVSGGTGLLGTYELTDVTGWVEEIYNEIGDKYEDKPLMRTILFGALTAKKVLSWIGETVVTPVVNWFRNKAIPWVGNAVNDIWSAITTFFTQTVPNWWKQHITDPIIRFFARIIGNIRTFIDNVIMAIGEVVHFITHPFTDSWADMCARIKSQWKTFTLETEKTSGEMKTKVVKDFNEMSQEGGNSGLKLQKEWNTNVAKMEDGTLETKKNITQTFSDLVTDVQGELVTLEEKWRPPKLELKLGLNTNGLAAKIAADYETIQRTLNKTPIVFNVTTASGVSDSYVNDSKNKLRYMDLYASGGSPDIGTLFWAGEAGAEVVANTSHGTGVMNVSQMQEAVANGNMEVVNAVYAMANMVVNAVNTKDFDVYMDASKVGQSVSKWQFNQARRGITQGAY